MAASQRALMIVIAVFAVAAPPAAAQVSSTTGAIVGTVYDDTKAVVPGVTVTVSGSAMMGTRTVVSDPDGGYRMPALSPGLYTLVFELPGFATVTRSDVRVTIGFTATINVEMSPAGLAENITVSGASPVVDLSSTKVTTNFGTEQLSNLGGTRDYAAITAQVPGVSMTRPSVGAAGAITFQRSTRYGVSGQDRGEVEGIVTTEAAAGGQEIGYSDSDSFEDMALNVIGNTAAMPQPGTLTVVISKSGGNTYRGRLYADYQSDAMQATNIDDRQRALGVAGTDAVATEDLNRVKEFRDFSADLGGYVIKDRLWWYAAYRRQNLEQGNPVLLDGLHRLSLTVFTAKVSANLTQNQKLSGYYSRGIKRQNPSIINSTTFATLDALTTQRWPNGPWKVEYGAIIGGAAVLELRTGNFFEKGYYDGTGAQTRYQDTGISRVYGTASTNRVNHQRPQVNGSITYSKSGWAGTHDFKFGGEVMHETDRGYTQAFDNQLLILDNNRPRQVRLYLPADTDRAPESELAVGAYVQDTWKFNSRLTMNLGFRFDQYRSYVPEQVGVTGQQFERIEAPVWTNTGPRLGVAYSLTSDDRTLLKASYGRFWDYPFNSVSSVMNPNPDQSSSLYAWTPANPAYVNGLPVFDPADIGLLISVTGARPDGRPATSVDPDLENTYQHQATAYVEREVASNFGVRTGFVWNGRRQGRTTVNQSQPFEAFNVPVMLVDPGPDGVTGNADDGGTVQAFNLDPAYLSLLPDQALKNLPSTWDSDHYTWEISATKRQSGRWSLLSSFSHTWSYAGTVAVTPNALINKVDGKDAFSIWAAKISATIDVPWDVRLSPMFRHQSGAPYARTFQARLNYNSNVSIQAERFGDSRLQNSNIFDMRTSKTFRTKRISYGVFFDVYNVFNNNADQVSTTTSGSAFLRPSVITAPRIARIGVKLDF